MLGQGSVDTLDPVTRLPHAVLSQRAVVKVCPGLYLLSVSQFVLLEVEQLIAPQG